MLTIDKEFCARKDFFKILIIELRALNCGVFSRKFCYINAAFNLKFPAEYARKIQVAFVKKLRLKTYKSASICREQQNIDVILGADCTTRIADEDKICGFILRKSNSSIAIKISSQAKYQEANVSN
ncbi:MAG: hypothetical protein LBI55_04090 [Oscillospiraceae bacterium]|jgi:hypothetical protein|nr:hypothetical protein [Oscillospiraceae bacterium]